MHPARLVPIAVLLAATMPLFEPLLGAQDRAIAFVNVSVIPMDREAVLADHTVIVQGGQIKAIGPAGARWRRTDRRTRTFPPAGAGRNARTHSAGAT